MRIAVIVFALSAAGCGASLDDMNIFVETGKEACEANKGILLPYATVGGIRLKEACCSRSVSINGELPVGTVRECSSSTCDVCV